MSVFVFFWLVVVLTLSLVLLQLRHSRKVSKRAQQGVDDARNILDASAEGVVTTSSTGEITKFNKPAEDIFGYKAEHVIGKNFSLLLPEETQKTHGQIMSVSSPDAASQSHEILAQKSDGTRFPLAINVITIRENNKPVCLGMFRDISVRKTAEVNSRKSQYLMEFLLQSSPIVFYTCQAKGSFPVSYVSPNIEKLFGYKPETITGAAAFWPRYIHPDDHDHTQASRILGIEEGRDNLEYRLKMPDGSYRWIADSRTMIKDDQGQPNLLVGCWTDIHSKKEAEVGLALKEERMRVSLQCANLATWDWVINTGEITWSGHINENLGLNEKLAGDLDGFTSIAHPEDRETLMEAFRHCLVKDVSLDIEYRVVWADKSVHWVHLIGELINDESGSPVRMAGVLFDITPQKQLRVASTTAVSANQA